jgi:DNA gyrase/topoisomerase IV subunit A
LSSSLSISDQINQKYREYALYVLQSRGIPNFYDSLTPVQRIVLENSPANYNKTIGLVGEVIRTGLYHHGDSSLSGAISKLARPFGCSHQLLEGDGFFGSPVNPSPSAPRYTSVKINSSIKDIIQKHYDLNEKNEEGGHDWLHLEVPIGLLTHIVGIAVGYRSSVLPRKMEDIVEYLEGKNKLLKPSFKDFAGKIYKFGQEENIWLIESGFEVNQAKRTIRIYDLPPVMRYDSFMDKIISKLEGSGYEYRLQNNSQSKCDILISFYKVQPKEFEQVTAFVKKQTQIVVKEDIVFIKDGNVAQFDSIKEYLDAFKVHLENVKLKRLIRDEDNLNLDLEFLEAKLKFLIFMSEKKRKNDEIIIFLEQFKKWISQKLSSIQIIKLSSDHIKETELEIKRIKSEIKKVQLLIKSQQAVVKKLVSSNNKVKSASLIPNISKPTSISIDSDIEIYEPDEVDEDDELL